MVKEKTKEKTKICTNCNVEKSLNSFFKNKTRPDGLDAYCKDCRNDYNKQQQQKKDEEPPEWAKAIIKDIDQLKKQQSQPPQIIQQPITEQQPIMMSEDGRFLADFLQRFGMPQNFIDIQLRKLNLRNVIPSVAELSSDVSSFKKDFKFTNFLAENYNFELSHRYQTHAQPTAYGNPVNPGYENTQLRATPSRTIIQNPDGTTSYVVPASNVSVVSSQPGYQPIQRDEMDTMDKFINIYDKINKNKDTPEQIIGLVKSILETDELQAYRSGRLGSGDKAVSVHDVSMEEIKQKYLLKNKIQTDSGEFTSGIVKGVFQNLPQIIAKIPFGDNKEQPPPTGQLPIICPNPECQFPFVIEPGATIVKCPKCQSEFDVEQPPPEEYNISPPPVETPEKTRKSDEVAPEHLPQQPPSVNESPEYLETAEHLDGRRKEPPGESTKPIEELKKDGRK